MAMLMQGKQTALVYAVGIGDEVIFDLLIGHGADVMMKGWVSFI